MASGGSCALIALASAPVVSHAPFSSQFVGLTTADRDVVGDWSNYFPTMTQFTHHAPGYIVSWEDGNSLDISRGKGGFAEAIEGTLVLPDILDDGTPISVALANGDFTFAGATVAWAEIVDYLGSDSISPVVDLDVYGAPEIGPGTVTLRLKSRSFSREGTLFRKVTVQELPCSATDITNPTDPEYPVDANVVTRSIYVPKVFGGTEVSVKTEDLLQVQRLVRWAPTTFQAGDLSVTTGAVALIPSLMGTAAIKGTYNADGSLQYAASLYFGCRTSSTDLSADSSANDAVRLVETMDRYVSLGYRIVLSDGRWFLDVTSTPHSAESVLSSVPEAPAPRLWAVSGLASKGYAVVSYISGMSDVSAPFAGVLFNLCDAEGTQQFDELPDATAVGIYAVPAVIPCAYGDVMVTGVAQDGANVASGFEQTLIDGATFAVPSCASQSGFLVAKSIKFIPALDATGLPTGPKKNGRTAIEGSLNVHSATASGTIETLNTDPSGAAGAGVSASFTYDVNTGDATARVYAKLRAGVDAISSEIGMVDISYTLDVNMVNRNGPIEIRGPYWNRGDRYPQVGSTSWRTRKAYVADRSPTRPNWRKSFRVLKDAESDTYAKNWNNLNGEVNTIKFTVQEMFLWEFQQLSFSSIYPTIYPNFSKTVHKIRSNCTGDATTGDTLIALDYDGVYWVGAVDSDGGATWTKRSGPLGVYPGNPTLVDAACDPDTGIVYLVGYHTDEFAAVYPFVQKLTAGGDLDGDFYAIAGASYSPQCCKIGNGYIAVGAAGGGDVYVHKLTDPVTTWTTITLAGGGFVFDIAYNGSAWIFVGNGYGTATADFSAVSTAGTWANRMFCATYAAPIGKWFAAGENGEIWSATVASPSTRPAIGAWTMEKDKADFGVNQITWFAMDWNMASLPGGARLTVAGTEFPFPWIESAYQRPIRYISPYAGSESFDRPQIGIGITSMAPCRSRYFCSSDGKASLSSFDSANEASPLTTVSPDAALQFLKVTAFGARSKLNPINWSNLQWKLPSGTPFGIGLSSTRDVMDATSPSDLIEKICRDWWGVAGEFAGSVDATNDPIDLAFPSIIPGAVEDIATVLSFSYAPFGGSYTKTAYIQNVDEAYVAGNDSYYFGGWDDDGAATTYGYDIWTACRSAYLKTKNTNKLSMSFDSVHTAGAMGYIFTNPDPDLGRRIDWICKQPRYLKVNVKGNTDGAPYGAVLPSAKAFCGCRYAPNQTLVTARGLGLPAWGIVVSANHTRRQGSHSLTIAFKPE